MTDSYRKIQTRNDKMIAKASKMEGDWKIQLTDKRLRNWCHMLGERVYMMKDRIIVACNFLDCDSVIVFKYEDL